MIKRIQSFPRWLRIIVFVLLVLSVIGIMLGVTLIVTWYSINGTPRTTAVAMQDTVTVREFVQFPDEDAYTAALTIAPDGTLYTASYVSGVVWQVTPEGTIMELPGTREAIGAVTGLDMAPDGTLYILDRLKPLETAGAVVWQIAPDNTLEKIFEVDETTLQLPYDIAAVDGYLFISDAVSRSIWRYHLTTKTGAVWWQLPADSLPTRITFNPQNQTLLVADTSKNALYAVPMNAEAPAESRSILYEYAGSEQEAPGFDGLAVGAENSIYVAALGLNRVAEINPQTGELDYLAGAFRGSSDIAYDAARHRLYVTNWEQRSLLPETFFIIQIDVQPHLPFAIDVLEWND